MGRSANRSLPAIRILGEEGSRDLLLAGAAAASINPRWTRAAGLMALGFSLVGTLVGITTIAIGNGPRTFADITYHIVIVLD